MSYFSAGKHETYGSYGVAQLSSSKAIAVSCICKKMQMSDVPGKK